MKNVLFGIALIACSINVYGDINLDNRTGKELDVTINPQYILIEYEEGFENFRNSFKFPSAKYYKKLMDAKLYMLTLVVTLDAEGVPVFNFPPNLKALNQELEKVRQAELAKIQGEVKAAAGTGQLPTGVTRIIGEYALPREKKAKK